MEKIIFFAPILEYPPAGGPPMSVANAIKALHPISELHIVTTVPPYRLGPEAMEFIKAHSHNLVFAPSSRFNSNHPKLESLLRKTRRVLAPILAFIDVNFTVKYAERKNIDIFWVDRVLEHTFSVFRQLRLRKPKAHIIGDTCSVYSRFVLRELPLIQNPLRKFWVAYKGRKKEREEVELTTKASVVTAVSELDAQYFRSIAPNPNTIKLFSNVVDLNDYNAEVPHQILLKKPYVLLMGAFGHVNSPMDRAAQWLLDDIMPRVWAETPNVHLYIVGKNSDKTLGHVQNDRVTVAGRVHSMIPYLKNAAATIVPLKYESGTRFKILESGAASIPCISTTLGAEGIQVTDQEDILIADTAEDFAAAIVKIVKDEAYAQILAGKLNTLVQKQYSIQTQQNDGETIIQFLKKGNELAKI